MKALFLLLISFSVFAQVQLNIDHLKTGKKFSAKFDTLEEANKWKVKQQESNSWGKKVARWKVVDSSLEEGYEVHWTPPVYELDADDNVVYDEQGEPIVLTPSFETEEKVANLTVTDISAEVQEEKDKETRLKGLRQKLNTPADLSLSEINELLRLER